MIGTELRKLREQKNLSQKDLAKHLGVTEQFISNIERNKATIPPPYVRTLAKLLNVKTETLVELLVENYRHQLMLRINCK